MQLPFLPVAAAAALALSACGDRASENVEAGPAAENEAAAAGEPEPDEPNAVAAVGEPEPAAPNEAGTAPAEQAVAPVARARPDRERRPPPPPPAAPKAEEPVVDPHAGHDMNDMDHD